MKIITLSDLADLLNFGAHCLEKQNVRVLKLRGARKVLFGLMVAVHNFVESIFSLCRESRTQACEALLRTLCDGLINVKFLYCAPRKHCHVIFLDALTEKKKQLNHGLAFLKQNPQYATEAKLDTKDILRSLKQVEQSEKATQNKIDQYPGKVISGTLERAKFVDSHNKTKNKKSYPLEWIYALIFRTLSAPTHLNFLNFPSYFKIEGNEIVVLLSCDPAKLPDILSLTSYIYKNILATFLGVFKSSLIKRFKTDFGE